MFIDLQCLERTNSEHNAGQPREIMRIIVKIMRIIVLEQCVRLLSLLYERLPVDAVALAFINKSSSTLISQSSVCVSGIAGCIFPFLDADTLT